MAQGRAELEEKTMERRSVLAGISAMLASTTGVGALFAPSAALAHDACGCWVPLHDIRVTQCCVLLLSDYDGDRVAFERDLKKDGGWGKVGPNEYLLWHDGRWHKSTRNEDHTGNPMRPDTLAADFALIAEGTRVCIPGLSTIFTVRDTGPYFKGKREINYLLGEGRAACASVRPIVTTVWIWTGEGEPTGPLQA
jgi:3D (Asp-Asp-Asp) domain-containing protein